MSHHPALRIVHETGIEGAHRATGTVVVIDVLRSFSVSAYALAGGARECLLVTTTTEARALAAATPGSVLCVEEGALPVEGIAISNSPTKICATDLEGRVLVQRSSAGTPVVAAVEAPHVFAASLVVARATVHACLALQPTVLTFVASADHPEDHACALYMEAVATGKEVDLAHLLDPLRDSDRYQRVMRNEWPGFPPTDVELALMTDRFPFAMAVSRGPAYHRLRRLDAPGTS